MSRGSFHILVAIVAPIGLVTLASGCAPMPVLCGRSIKLGHPTMTAEDIPIGAERRIRDVTEGATGALGGHAIATAR